MLLRRRREIAGSVSQFTYWLGDLADDQQSAMDRPNGNGILLKGTAMQIVVGPVLTRQGGYAFDCWIPEQGLSPGYTYGRVEDAHYAPKVEIRSPKQGCSHKIIACSTVDEFARLMI
jgi:hypothetical protein